VYRLDHVNSGVDLFTYFPLLIYTSFGNVSIPTPSRLDEIAAAS